MAAGFSGRVPRTGRGLSRAINKLQEDFEAATSTEERIKIGDAINRWTITANAQKRVSRQNIKAIAPETTKPASRFL